jgi:hypothetical protein
LGLQDNYIYNSSLGRALKGKWSTETIFSNPGEAFEGLALDYFNSSNKAQKVFTSRAVGIYIESKAAQMGSTLGGASQLLKTGIGVTSKIGEIKYPAINLKSGYQFRGSYIF